MSQELRDKGDLNDSRRETISEAIDAVSAVLERTNSYIDREERLEAVHALKSQVEDWRNHRVEAFGELLLHGTHTVIKGDGMNSEREVSFGKISEVRRLAYPCIILSSEASTIIVLAVYLLGPLLT